MIGPESWLLTRLAPPAGRALAGAILGTAQQRALDSVAIEAVRLTARAFHPDDPAQAEQLELVLRQVFSNPLPEGAPGDHSSVIDAVWAGVTAQLAVLDDVALTGQGQSSAQVLGLPVAELADELVRSLWRQIISRGSRGGPLEALANQLNHDETHETLWRQHAETMGVLRPFIAEFSEILRNTSDASLPESSSSGVTDASLRAEQLLEGLPLGDHDEAERRVNRLFMLLERHQQQAFVEAVVQVAEVTTDHTVQLLASSLLEAADRLDPMLLATEAVESLARSAHDALRSTAAMLMWQWAETLPGRVPIHLLARLAVPSKEDWYVHAPAEAAAKQLLLSRAAARVVFDQLAASRDREDRQAAVLDLLDIARVEPRAIPLDLAQSLAKDHDSEVRARAIELLTVAQTVSSRSRTTLHSKFGL